MSEYCFIKCDYNNIIGNTVVSRTYCEHPFLGAATLTVSQGWRDQNLLKAGRNVAIAIVSHQVPK